jgi:hypothetical protein
MPQSKNPSVCGGTGRTATFSPVLQLCGDFGFDSLNDLFIRGFWLLRRDMDFGHRDARKEDVEVLNISIHLLPSVCMAG